MAKFVQNRFTSFISGKCPRCQTGRVFETSALHPRFQKVRDTCDHCGVKYAQEPGFFWGAMYFSYALVVGWCIFAGIIFYSIYEEPPLFLTSGVIIGSIILLLPLIARLSRLLLIYLIAPYRAFDSTKAGH